MKSTKAFWSSVLLAVVIFLVLSAAYMLPALEGKNVSQHDIMQHKGMAKEIEDYRAKTGKEALWTNSIFGGMPAYLISTQYKTNLVRYVHYILNLNNWRPVSFVFLYLLGFYIALLCFGVDRWLSIAGAIAYGFSSYFFTIILAGHNAKVLALGYMPPIIAGAYLAYNGRYLLGSVIFGLFLALQIFVVHLQITYYTMLVLVIYFLFEGFNKKFYKVFTDRSVRSFYTSTGYLAVAALLAIGSNTSYLWTTYEYGQYSMRGKPELTLEGKNQTSGLDKDYATQWSYGVSETFTLLIPSFKGGASDHPLPENSETFELLKMIKERNPKAGDPRKEIKHMPTYWGDQSSTSGPFYAGAIVVFLFVLGLFIIKSKIKWWLLTVTVLSIMLAWGRNFPALTHFFLDYFPAYNKFRTVSMILIMASFTMPLLGMLAVNDIINGKIDKKQLMKPLLNSFYITAGLCLFFIITAKMFFDFTGGNDQYYISQGATEFVNALQKDRLMLFQRDAFRSMVFIALGFGSIYLFVINKISKNYFIAGIGVLILIDMWIVDKRYLNKDDFISKRKYENPIAQTKADDFILKNDNSDPNYRVLNLTTSPFQDATTSFWHKSIGGYHGAKMRRYQELADHYMIMEMQEIINALRTGSFQNVDSTLSQAHCLNMLNTRFIIYHPEAMPITNPYRDGNAWFVGKTELADDPDEELAILGNIDPSHVAVIHKEFSGLIPSNLESDPSASIGLISYEPNKLVYRSKSGTEQLALFSEIYYPAKNGWKAEIDGKEVTHFRANFILRALTVPAGDHEIVFTFRPGSFYTGNKVSLASSLVLILLVLGTFYLEIRKKGNQ